MEKQTFRAQYGLSITVVMVLLLIQTHLAAAPLVLPQPVSLNEETIVHLKRAHIDEKAQWQLVVFGYTRCKDVCPTSLGNLSMLIQAASSEKIKLNGTFVSIDPDRDNATALASYTERFGKEITYLRFEDEELERFKKSFGVEVTFFTKNKGNMQHYQVDHSTTAFLINPAGQIKVMFDVVKDAADVAELFKENKALFKL